MTIIKEGPYGRDGGKPFSLDYFTSVVKIGVACGDGTDSGINGITIWYKVNGVQKPPVTFGETGEHSFTLQDGEYIKSVEGHYDSSGVRALKFVTSITTHGPYGNEVGTCFNLPANNGTIVGFHGRAEKSTIDALGDYLEDGHTGGSIGTGF